jgi:hypothetical protein
LAQLSRMQHLNIHFTDIRRVSSPPTY